MTSFRTLTNLGRQQLSPSFFMRDFLYSEISQIEGIANIPENPEIAIETGKMLCNEVLEPIQQKLGRISIRSAYRSPTINGIGAANNNQYNCSKNEKNYAKHIWDIPNKNGHKGAMACIVVNSFLPYYEKTGNWQALAWWIHDNIPDYSTMYFFPKLCAFNIGWQENAVKRIDSYIKPKGCLTKQGMDNFNGCHKNGYIDFLNYLWR